METRHNVPSDTLKKHLTLKAFLEFCDEAGCDVAVVLEHYSLNVDVDELFAQTPYLRPIQLLENRYMRDAMALRPAVHDHIMCYMAVSDVEISAAMALDASVDKKDNSEMNACHQELCQLFWTLVWPAFVKGIENTRGSASFFIYKSFKQFLELVKDSTSLDDCLVRLKILLASHPMAQQTHFLIHYSPRNKPTELIKAREVINKFEQARSIFNQSDATIIFSWLSVGLADLLQAWQSCIFSHLEQSGVVTVGERVQELHRDLEDAFGRISYKFDESTLHLKEQSFRAFATAFFVFAAWVSHIDEKEWQSSVKDAEETGSKRAKWLRNIGENPKWCSTLVFLGTVYSNVTKTMVKDLHSLSGQRRMPSTKLLSGAINKYDGQTPIQLLDLFRAFRQRYPELWTVDRLDPAPQFQVAVRATPYSKRKRSPHSINRSSTAEASSAAELPIRHKRRATGTEE